MQAVAEGVHVGPAHKVPGDARTGERMGQGVVQELAPPALPYPRSSRFLHSTWPSKLRGRGCLSQEYWG